MSFVNRLPLTIASCYEVVHLELTRDEDHGIIDDDLAHIIPWCPNLETVRLTGIPDLTDRTVVLLARTAPQLLELDISGCIHITDTAILELAKLATDLEAVKLNGLATLTDPSISALARSLTELSELEICNLPLITPLTIRAIWTFSTGLKRLKVAHCIHLTDKAFPYPPPRRERIARRSRASTALSVSATQDPSRSSNGTRPSTWLDDLPPLEFSPGHKLSDLRLLDLSYCMQLTDIAIAGIVAYAPRIQHLNLSGCMALSDSAAEAIATLGSHLNELTMPRSGSLTDRGVVSIVRTCSQLKSVDVSCESSILFPRLVQPTLTVLIACNSQLSPHRSRCDGVGDAPAPPAALCRWVEASHGQCGSVPGGAYSYPRASAHLAVQAAGAGCVARCVA